MSFALAIASASSLKGIKQATGPKISSWAMRIRLSTSANTVGLTKLPFLSTPALAGVLKNGNFVKPTVFADVDNRMRIAQEEIFGPVACLIPFKDEADAIAKANDIAYGLSSYVWTENGSRALRVASAIEAGMCFVNSQNVRDLRQPFGGTKASGVGREGGIWSYEVFLEPKNVCVSLGSHPIPRWGV